MQCATDRAYLAVLCVLNNDGFLSTMGAKYFSLKEENEEGNGISRIVSYSVAPVVVFSLCSLEAIALWGRWGRDEAVEDFVARWAGDRRFDLKELEVAKLCL